MAHGLPFIGGRRFVGGEDVGGVEEGVRRVRESRTKIFGFFVNA